MKKPSKKQKAIIALLNVIESEGVHYGVINYGVDDHVKDAKDEMLESLVKDFIKSSKALEDYLEELKEQVTPFLPDESDF